jgi:hypothetical protein
MPVFDSPEGHVIAMDVGRATTLTDTIRGLLEGGVLLEDLLPVFTTNVARQLRLANKGRIAPGADADLVILADDHAPAAVMARGRWLLRDRLPTVFGTFEVRVEAARAPRQRHGRVLDRRQPAPPLHHPRRHRRRDAPAPGERQAGVHVAGTSAGAAFVSEHMIAFGREGSTPIAGQVTLTPGLGLTNRVIVDQHFRERDRLGRLLTALAYNPFAIGLGLDEDTAAFISARLLLRRPRRLHPPPARGGGHLARPRARARRDRAARTSLARTSPSARPAGPTLPRRVPRRL